QVLVNPNRLVSVLVECRVSGDAEASHVVCGLGVFRGLGKVLVVGFRAAAVFLELREGGNNGVFRVNTQSVASLRAGLQCGGGLVAAVDHDERVNFLGWFRQNEHQVT